MVECVYDTIDGIGIDLFIQDHFILHDRGEKTAFAPCMAGNTVLFYLEYYRIGITVKQQVFDLLCMA